MRIELVSIESYKSFWARQTFQFEPGFNLLVGANNAGKTTVLDVIDLDFNLNEPHRSAATIPNFGGLNNQHAATEVALVARFRELRKLVGSNHLYLPITPPPNSNIDQLDATGRVLEFIDRDGDLRLVSTASSGIEDVTVFVDHLIRGGWWGQVK